MAPSAIIAPLLAGKWRKYRAIEARDVAAAMIEAAKQNKEGCTVYEYDEMKRLITRSADRRENSDEDRESILDKNASGNSNELKNSP